MGLQVVTAAPNPLLTSVASLKANVLGATATSTAYDTQFETAIRRASDWASRYVGYALPAAAYCETLAGYGMRNLMLARTPVRAVQALYFGTDTGGDAVQVLSTEFILDDTAGFLARIEGWDWSVPVLQEIGLRPVPGQEYEPWLAYYVAGFTLDGVSTADAIWSTEKGTTSTERTLPYDIEQAVLVKAAAFYRGQDDAVLSKKVGDLAITYGQSDRTGLRLDPAETLLAPYRRTF